MKVRLEITLGDVHQFFLSGFLAVVLCSVTFHSADALTSTARQGFEKSVETFSESFSRTFDRVLARFEELSVHPEDMGLGATLVRRIPYLQDARQYATKDGALVRLELEGSNLDTLAAVRVDDLLFSRRNEPEPRPGTFFHDPGLPFVVQLDLENRTHPRLEAGVTLDLESVGGVRTAFPILLRYLPAREEDILKGIFSGRRYGTGEDPAPTPTATPRPQGSGAPSPPPPDPLTGPAEGNRAVEQFRGIVRRYADEDPDLRDRLIPKVVQAKIHAGDLLQLLRAIDRARSLEEPDKDRGYLEVLRADLIVDPGGGTPSLHSVSAENIELALSRLGRGALMQHLERAEHLHQGLIQAFERARVIGVTDSGGTGGSGSGVHTGSGEDPSALVFVPESEDDYRQIYDDELVFRRCMAVIETVHQAHEASMANVVGDRPLDVNRLRKEGFLAHVPTCPAGPELELDSSRKQMTCPTHGSRSRPWARHDLYLRVFKEYDQGRRLALDRKRSMDALRILIPYSRKHPNNIFAQAVIGEALFRVHKHADAIRYLEPLAHRYGGNVRFHYLIGMSFYARDNLGLAREWLERAVGVGHGAFDFSYTTDLSAYDYYVMRDTARASLADIARQVDYAGSILKAEAIRPSRRCFDQVKRIIEVVPELIKVIRGKEAARPDVRFSKLRDRIHGLQDELDRDPGDDRSRVLCSQLQDQRQLLSRALRETVERVVAGRKVFRSLCPAGGLYHLDRLYDVQCTVHPGILPGSKVPLDDTVDVGWETRLVNLAILHGTGLEDPVLGGCFFRQTKVLVTGFRDPRCEGAFEDPTAEDLAELVRSGEIEPGLLRRGVLEVLQVMTRDSERYLGCTLHPSLQDMTRLTVGEPPGEVVRPFELLYIGP